MLSLILLILGLRQDTRTLLLKSIMTNGTTGRLCKNTRTWDADVAIPKAIFSHI